VTGSGERADGLPVGPRDPLRDTPQRRPGSVRRTTTVDQRRGGPGEPQHVVAVGRDLRTDADGDTKVLALAWLQATVELGDITELEVFPPVPALAELVGGSISRGLRQRADALAPAHREGATVLHQLLDDLPLANLISSYGSSRETPDFTLPPDRADAMTDLCSGWKAGGTMLRGLTETGIFPIPLGPSVPAPALPPDPMGWHEAPPMARRSIRRARRLDVWEDGGVLQVDVHFRDSHCDADGLEDELHEYTIAVTVDPADLVVLGSEATARVLPWPECPGALASAGRIVGQEVAGLRPLVAADFTGTTTCTHLNDSLRSLAGVVALAKGVA
jgi:hypothetical protein